MSNRYLYRAKRSDNGEWVEGHLVTDEQNKDKCFIGYVFGTNDDGTPHDFDVVPVDSCTICQCTGIPDKNGKLIYENDIVSAWSEGTNAIGNVKKRQDGLYIMYPAYQKQEFWGLCPDESGRTTVEVIGNIFDKGSENIGKGAEEDVITAK